MKKIVVAFTGQTNIGKTTLILKLSKYLQKLSYKVCIIKHDPCDKAIFDKEGKDSYRFFSSGADVAVVSPTRTTLFQRQTSSIDHLVNLFGEFDYLLVEGLKTLPLPRIAVQRETLRDEYFEQTDAIATDSSIKSSDIPRDCVHLDLDDLQSIKEWIDKNGKRYE